MSDHTTGPTRDPIEQLENFGTGGIAVNPLDPAVVRRLGDQRRKRQHSVYGAIAAVVVAAAIIPTALLATQGDDDPGHRISTTPTPTPTPTVIAFPDGGVAIKAPEDTDKLVGTSDEFKTFIKGVWQKDHDQGCKTAEIDVMKYSSDGFGLGGVGGCGGYMAVWVLAGGVWKEALATQDEWICADLTRYDVPDGFAGECYVPKPPTVIEFPVTGELVKAPGDSAKLEGTSAEFKAFIEGVLQKDHEDCPTPYVAVDKYTSDGFAIGTTGGCDNHYVLWMLQDGTWKEALTDRRGDFTCADFARYHVPYGFAGDCDVPDPPPAVITYPWYQGVHVTSESDAAKLEGSPEDFKEFIVSLVPDVQAGLAECSKNDPGFGGDPADGGVRVTKYAQAGYALGSVDGCSGYNAIWKKVDGSWKQVLASQEQWMCSNLARFEIPRSFVGGCLEQPQ